MCKESLPSFSLVLKCTKEIKVNISLIYQTGTLHSMFLLCWNIVPAYETFGFGKQFISFRNLFGHGSQLSEFVPGSFGFHVLFFDCKLKVTQQRGMYPGADFDCLWIMGQPKASWEVSVVFNKYYNLGLLKKKMFSMNHKGQA